MGYAVGGGLEPPRGS